jgi:NTP pyrophosphatase (non-canonical NTP hydrolase)
MITIHDKIRKWGEDKGLTGPAGKATVAGQLRKLDEEFDELETAIDEEDTAEAADAIGDMTVVLVLLAELLGLRYEDCVYGAYEVISKRTGVMRDGVFVKDTQKTHEDGAGSV